jgi:hypothetical protein
MPFKTGAAADVLMALESNLDVMTSSRTYIELARTRQKTERDAGAPLLFTHCVMETSSK